MVIPRVTTACIEVAKKKILWLQRDPNLLVFQGHGGEYHFSEEDVASLIVEAKHTVDEAATDALAVRSSTISLENQMDYLFTPEERRTVQTVTNTTRISYRDAIREAFG